MHCTERKGNRRHRVSRTVTGLLATLGVVVSWSVAADEPLAFSGTHASVGTMQVGETKSVALTLTNRSTDPIEIESVTSSCSCTTATLDQTTLAPGETASLTAEVLHEMYVTPDIRSQITVRAKGYPDVETSVLVEGHLDAPFHAEPASVVFDANMLPVNALPLALRSRDEGAFTITRFEAPRWLSVARRGTGESTAFDVQLAEAVPYELLQGEITFWTEDPRQPVVRVPVKVTSTPSEIEVSPRIMRLGQVKPGQTGVPVVLRTRAGTAEPVLTASIDGLAFRVDAGTVAGEFVITPIIKPDAATGAMRGAIRATVLHGSREEHVEIGVIGTVVVAQAD